MEKSTSLSTSLFSSTYREARGRFRTAAEAAGAKLESLPIRARGPEGEELTIEIASFGNLNGERVFVHTSGVHGVEGFAGSAVQLALLERRNFSHDFGLVFVHSVNPFGMAWYRRVNENNVDLNRNFLKPGEAYSGSPKGYAALDRLLNTDVSFFIPRLFASVAAHGFTTVKNVIAGGQYDYPRGLFFGGSELQEGPRRLLDWIRSNVRPSHTMMQIDVHTGLGGFGREILFCQAQGRPPDIGRSITPLNSTRGYRPRGAFDWFTEDLFRDRRCIHFVEEIGTYSMVRVLGALRRENLNFRGQIGAANLRLMELMNPPLETWRSSALALGVGTFDLAANWLGRQ